MFHLTASMHRAYLLEQIVDFREICVVIALLIESVRRFDRVPKGFRLLDRPAICAIVEHA